MSKIAFIGLGHMGGPMAVNLCRAGHTLWVYDLNESAMLAVEKVGAHRAESALAAASQGEFVVTMLPASAHAQAVYLGSGEGQDGLLDALDSRPILIDCSTIAPAVSREISATAENHGFAMLDAPVSGGTAGAAAGTLTFMVGGKESVLEQARPLFACMGANVFHAGGNGAGQAAKVCNNMLLAIHMAGTAETLQLGANLGLEPRILNEIMLRSSGRNWSLETYNPFPGLMPNVPAAREYADGFACHLMTKDLGLAVEAALQTDSTTPLGSLARALYQQWTASGHADLDFSSIQQWYSARPDDE